MTVKRVDGLSAVFGGVTGLTLTGIQGGPEKSKPLPNDQKTVLKPVSEIRFISQIKV